MDGRRCGRGVAVALCLAAFGPLSLGLSCAGIFYPSLAADIGVSTGLLGWYTPAMWIASLVALPLLGRLLMRLGARVCMTAAAVAVALDFVALSFTGGLAWFVACGLVMGASVAMLLFLAPSTLVNLWFPKRAGALLGVVMACAGVGGAVWCAVGGLCIEAWGWQAAYRLFCVLSLVLGAVPSALLVRGAPPAEEPARAEAQAQTRRDAPVRHAVARLSPEVAARVAAARERLAGKRGSGSAGEFARPLPTETGVSVGSASASGLLLLIADIAFILNFGMFLYFLIPSFATSLPAASAFPLLGALASSAAMAGQTASKIVLGFVGDRAPAAGTVAGIAAGLAGMAALWFCAGEAALVLAGAFLFGAFCGVANVMMPLFTRLGFGMRDYPRIYAKVSMAASLGAIVSGVLWSAALGVTDSYAELFVGIATLLCIALALVTVLARRLRYRDEG